MSWTRCALELADTASTAPRALADDGSPGVRGEPPVDLRAAGPT